MKSTHVKCFSKVYEDNFYHFIVQQLHGLYLYKLNNNYEKLNFYYDGPFIKIAKEIPFLNLLSTLEEPADCVAIEPVGTLAKNKSREYKLLEYSEYLKKLFLPKILKTVSENVLIVQRANNRIIKNDDLLFLALKNFGNPQIATLECMPFMSQIEAVHNSKIIIASHGAGLTHMLFAAPGTIFIELYSKGFHGYYPYKDIAEMLGLRWDYVEANYSSLELYNEKQLTYLANYKTDDSGKIPADILLCPTRLRLRQLIRDPRYISCSISEIIQKISTFLAK